MKREILVLVFLGYFLSINAQNVGINADGSQPNTSAGLDINFSNKGVLIPQIALTGANDATTILTPATSLLIYNTVTVDGLTPGYYYNSGSTLAPVWTRLVSGSVDGSETKITAGTNVTISGSGTTASPYVINASSSTHHLGEDYLGGIIFYLYTGSDGQQHGLIVSKTETTATWGGSTPVGANKPSDGAYNTNLMATGTGTARTWVESLGADWYLPAFDELSLLWRNRFHVNNSSASGLTLFQTSGSYYSSTETNSGTVLYLDFKVGYGATAVKSVTLYVRGVRSF